MVKIATNKTLRYCEESNLLEILYEKIASFFAITITNKVSFKLIVFSFFFTHFSFSQNTHNIGGRRVEIVNAGSLKSATDIADGAKRLIGNVQFKQDNVLMFCDSAYFYKNNSLDAFGHIHIQQDDSLHMYGDFLNYDGNTKKAILTKNVVVDKGDMHLTTDVLNYDVSKSIGYYTTPGRIINRDNILTSDHGYYFSKANDFHFKKNVVLTNPQFVINCDTMKYNTQSKITYFVGPTTIKSKNNLIYCEDGYYDTFKDQSRFSKNSYIISGEQKMIGDSLYYDRKKGVGRAVKNVQIIDTAQNINITGMRAIHYELTATSIITENALLTQIYDKDTLYLHADTLKSVGEVRDSTKSKAVDTTKKMQKLFAYHKVKFFKRDLQGKCDSLYYTNEDSTMKLFRNPTIWSDVNQLTGDSITIFVGKKSIKAIELRGSAFIVSEEDSIMYNQVRGKYMKGFFKDDKLARINVRGNGQTIYYVEEKEEIKAVNRTDCTDLNIYLKENEMDRITFITKPESTLFPIDLVALKDFKLKDFSWRIKQRPKDEKDIFNWN